VVTGVVRRWHWLLRVSLALVWVLLLTQSGWDGKVAGPVALATYLAYGVLGFLLLRQWLQERRPAPATA
jgi:hypothetical protein